MGQSVADWKACGISQAVSKTDFSIDVPVGYTHASSPFKNSEGAKTCQCEVCCHEIKTAYMIQNDTAKQFMVVGSECVKLFGGSNGEQLVIDALIAAYDDTYEAAEELACHIAKKFSTMSFYTNERMWKSDDAEAAVGFLNKITKSYIRKGDAIKLSWMNNYASQINEMKKKYASGTHD